MSAREDVLPATLTAEHLRRIEDAQAQFAAFCERLRVPICAEAVAIYMTFLFEEGASGRALQRAIQHLDAAARLAGQTPWTEQGEISRLIRGLRRERGIGGTGPRSDPIHAELVYVMVGAVMSPTPGQIQNRTAMLLAVDTGLTRDPLLRIEWRHVRMLRRYADITVLPPPARPKWDPKVYRIESPRTLAALRLHRAANHHGPGPLFANSLGTPDARLGLSVFAPLRAHGGDVEATLAAIRTSPKQVLLRALLLFGYNAALRTKEAIALNQGDVEAHPHGLLLRIDGRQAVTAIPSDPGQPTDPVAAWEAWLRELDAQGFLNANGPAFPASNGTSIWGDKRVREARLNDLVQEAATTAGLSGDFTFTGLRSGLIRTALRSEQQAHDVAAHTDLRSLGSLVRHERRENILRRSVAGQLGL